MAYKKNNNRQYISQNNSSGVTANSARGSLGIVLSQNAQGETLIQKVIGGSPANKSGIVPGEALIAIDGINIAGRSLSSIQTKLRGRPGSYVDLTLRSKTRGEYKQSLKRASEGSLKTNSPTTKNNFQSPKKNFSRDFNSKPVKASTAISTTSSTNSVTPGLVVKWTNYTSPSGAITMQVPDGWEVEIDNKTGKIETYSFDDESLAIFPFFLPSKQLDQNQARGLFNALLKTQFKNQKWTPVQAAGQNALKRTYKGNGLKQVASIVWRPTKVGTLGRFFIAQAPQGSSEHYSKIFSNILASLKYPSINTKSRQRQNLQVPIPPQISWTKYVDPKQGAFSVEVPQGWQISGALEQPQAVDTRTWVKVVAPDQSIAIFMGDPSIPSYTVPTMQLTSLGFPPGARYSPGYGFNTIVAYYTPAQKYVPNYGRKMLKKLSMNNLQLRAVNSHPDLARAWNEYYNTRQYSAASCQFSCLSNGKPATAFFIGSTRKEQSLWYVTTLGSVLSLKGKENLAMQIYLHMYKSFQMNPNWQQSQLRVTKRFSKLMFSTWRQINQIARESYEYRNAIEDKTHRKVVNALRGTQDVVDPGTGTVYNVESGPDYHWINNDGYTHLGTNQIIYPGANWTQLVNVP